jgi:glycosyltransferase involved in cell wall biosynthesis
MTQDKKQNPIVSVLLPVYNGKDYLDAAVQSILDQTYADFECIIINDGSRDRSTAIINKYNDARIRVYHQENQGLAATLNRAISLARGEYLARQDQDDISLPQRFEKQVAFLETHPDYGMVGTWAEIVSGDHKTDRAHKHPADNLTLKFELLFNNPFVHSSMMIRKSVFEKIGPYSTDATRQPPEDYELWSRIARTFEVANIPEILLVYREVPKSMSRMGPNPFLEKLVKLSAENIAFATGRELGDPHCVALAALEQGVYRHVDKGLSFGQLERLLSEAVDGLSGRQDLQGNRTLKDLARQRLRSRWRLYLLHRYFGFVVRAVRSFQSRDKETPGT